MGRDADSGCVAMLGMVDRVRALLQPDPSQARAVGAHGLSVLYHAAVRFGQIETARWLLDHGANVNASDYERKTPLRVAVELGHADVAELLRRWDGHE